MDGRATPDTIPISSHQQVRPDQPEQFTVRTELGGRYALVSPDGVVLGTSADFKGLAEIRNSLNNAPRNDLRASRTARKNSFSALFSTLKRKTPLQPKQQADNRPLIITGQGTYRRAVMPADVLPPKVAPAASLPVLGDGKGVMA